MALAFVLFLVVAEIGLRVFGADPEEDVEPRGHEDEVDQPGEEDERAADEQHAFAAAGVAEPLRVNGHAVS